jgi:hypothetical protein
MIKTTGTASVILAAATALSGCSMSSPERDSRRHQEVTVDSQLTVSIAFMKPEGGFRLNEEAALRLPMQKPDFIIDNDHGVWKRGSELSSCQGAFAIPSIQAFGTYYIPASESERRVVKLLASID